MCVGWHVRDTQLSTTERKINFILISSDLIKTESKNKKAFLLFSEQHQRDGEIFNFHLDRFYDLMPFCALYAFTWRKE